MSQLLILIYNYIDKGVQTCGLDFHFDIPDEDEKRREQTTPMITMMKTPFRTADRYGKGADCAVIYLRNCQI